MKPTEPNQHTSFEGKRYFALYDASQIKHFSSNWLSAQYWQKQSAIVGTAQGRGTTYFIEHEGKHWVLRHYYRGGLIGKLINDHYFFTGYQRSRAVKEYRLLAYLQEKQLPAPAPIACHTIKKGLFYQGDILSSRIENASDLVDKLQQAPLTDTQWYAVGQCIASFHQHNVYHHDLNCHNILLDKNDQVWLIDFDQGEIRDAGGTWRQQNLARLHRSFSKEKQKLATFHWQEKNWQQLLSGYHQN